jgi:hypothetical protein
MKLGETPQFRLRDTYKSQNSPGFIASKRTTLGAKSRLNKRGMNCEEIVKF